MVWVSVRKYMDHNSGAVHLIFKLEVLPVQFSVTAMATEMWKFIIHL